MNATVSLAPMAIQPLAGFRKFTVEQYHKMIRTGVLFEGEEIELLEGYLVNKMPQNPAHSSGVSRIASRLPRRLPEGWFLRSQLPVSLTESEPEPDAAIVRGNDTSYDLRHPSVSDFGIAIEVSDSTLPFDRRDKLRIYATAGIPVYWIVNLVENQIEVYADPQSATYQTRNDFAVGAALPLVLDGVTVFIPVSELLP